MFEDFWKKLKEFFYPVGVVSKREERPSIEFHVEKIKINMQDVVDYANNRLNGILQIDEFVVVDNQANPQLLEKINKHFNVNVDDSVSILYFMDVLNKNITKICCYCIESIEADLEKELVSNNHVIRMIK